MISWPDDLVSDIARRRAVLFLGSGVSKNSVGNNGKRPATWIEFLDATLVLCAGSKSLKTALRKLIRNGDLLTACEIIKKRLGHLWVTALTDEFLTPAYSFSPLHESLFKIDARLVLTQNFDKIYDTYAQHVSHGTVSVKNYYDNDIPRVLRGAYRVVLKVHGTIDQPNQMIFTRDEYLTARYQYPAFYTILDALVLTHTFVFIGCGLSDPDMQMFLERYSYSHPSGPPHYIVMPKTKSMHQEYIASAEKNMNVKILIYSPAQEHLELRDSISNLVQLVDAKRDEFATNRNW